MLDTLERYAIVRFAGASILVSFPDFESQATRQIWEGFRNQATAILLCGNVPKNFSDDYKQMPLCTEKQVRASKYINPLMTKSAEPCG